MKKPYYSIIIPAYNEEKIISSTINKVYLFLKKQKVPFELIITDDGSKDSTLKIAEDLSKKHKEIRIVSNKINQGRGAALNNAFKNSKGEVLVYIDADLAIDLNLFPRLMKAIKEQGADIAVGSKHLKESQVEYPKLRRIFSKCYAFLAYLLLRSKIKDYQCGFKAFKREKILQLLPYLKNKGWAWDTEVIIKAQWMGWKVIELPAKVINIYGRESKVKLFNDVKRMGLDLLNLYFEKKKFMKNI